MKIRSFFIIIISFITIIFTINTYSFAAGGTKSTTSSSTSSGDTTTQDLISGMNPTNYTSDTGSSRLRAVIAQFFTVLQFAGTGISVIMVMWLGISYMISSVDQKAEIKKRMVPVLIGSILIVATVNILKFLSKLMEVSVTTDTTP